MGRIKQPLGRQLLFQLLKCSVQIADAIQRHGGAVKLVSTVPGVYGNAAHGNDLHAVLRTETQAHGIALEDHALQRAAFIL